MKMQRESVGFAATWRRTYQRHREKVIKVLMVATVVLLLIASFVPPLGNWLENIRFAGPSLLMVVGFVLFDAVTNDRAASADDEQLVALRPRDLLPYFKAAANKPNFDVIFVGYSSETLYGLLNDCFYDLEMKRLHVDHLSIKMLLPDCSEPMAVPCTETELQDLPEFRALSESRTREYVGKIRRGVLKLQLDKIIMSGTVEVHFHRLSPMVKLYVLNGDTAFWGLYPIESSVYQTDAGDEIGVYDFKGARTPMMGARTGHSVRDLETVRTISQWVDRLWETASYADSPTARRGERNR